MMWRFNWIITFRRAPTPTTPGGGESNRAKTPDEGCFVPEGDPLRTKIAPLGQSPGAPGARLLAQSGYFSSVPFSRSKEFYPYFLEILARAVLGHNFGRGARIKILKELSYGNLSA
jgi:hypothetical protein